MVPLDFAKNRCVVAVHFIYVIDVIVVIMLYSMKRRGCHRLASTCSVETFNLFR